MLLIAIEVFKRVFQIASAQLVFVLAVLNEGHGLGNAEVIGSTPGNTEGIFLVAARIVITVHDRVDHESRAEGTDVIRSAQRSIALVVARLIVFLRISFKRV